MHTPQPITHMTLRLIKNWPQFLQYWMIYSPCCSPSIHWSILLLSLFVPPAECCNWSAAFFLTEDVISCWRECLQRPWCHQCPSQTSSWEGKLPAWPLCKVVWQQASSSHTLDLPKEPMFFSWLGFKMGIFWGAAPLPQETKRKKVSWPTGRRDTPSCVETENRSLLPVGSQERSRSGTRSQGVLYKIVSIWS